MTRAFARPCSNCLKRVEAKDDVCPHCGTVLRKPRQPQPQRDRVAAQPWRKRYRSAEYQKSRLLRYQLAGGCCEACGRPVGKGQWEAHHRLELRLGGTDDVENLQILCIVKRPGARRGCHGLVKAR